MQYEMNKDAPQNAYLILKHQLAHSLGPVPCAQRFFSSIFPTVFFKSVSES